MGINLIPLQQPRPSDVAPERLRSVPVVHVKWSGLGAKELTIRELATQACSDANEIFDDLLGLRANAHVVEQLFRDHGLPAHKKLVDRIKNDADLKKFAGLMLGEPDDQTPGDITEPASAFPNIDTRAQFLRVLRGLGEQFLEWKLNVDKPGIILTLEHNQHHFTVCSKNRSTIEWLKPDVDAYQAAVKKLEPHLKKIESALTAYEAKAKNWSQTLGKDPLDALAIIAAFESVTDVYRKQNPKAELLNAHARELVEQTSNRVVSSLQSATSAEVQALRKVDTDRAFIDALFEFYLLWDPTQHYYFHAVAAKAVGAPDFDKRLFHALRMMGQYQASSPKIAKEVGEEMSRALALIWADAVEAAPVANETLSARRLRARKKLDELRQLAGVQSSIATAALWSGYVTTWVGNFEGPPSVLSLVLTMYSKSEHFVRALQSDTMLKGVLMFGVSRLERLSMLQEIKAGRIETARKLFNNASWRSPAMYAAFTAMTIAITIAHVDALVDKLAKDGDQAKFDGELFTIVGQLVQDAANIGLIGLTALYSRDLNAFLEYNAKARTGALGAVLESLETKGWRVIAVRATHGILAGVGVLLSAWDYIDNRGRVDAAENLIKIGMVGASIMCVLGVCGVTSWLGPAGFVLGVVLAIGQGVYTKFFKSKIAGTLEALLNAYGSSPFFVQEKDAVVGTTTWAIFFAKTVTLEDILDKARSTTVSMDHPDRPDRARMLDYFRSGIPVPALAELYDIEETEVQDELKKVKFQRTQAFVRSQTVDVQLLEPALESTAIILGATNRMRVIVFNHRCSAVWLEWTQGDPAIFLSGDAFDPINKVILLRVDSSTRRRSGTQEMVGEFSINLAPAATGGRIVTPFMLKVPKLDRPVFPAGEFQLARALNFPVIDI